MSFTKKKNKILIIDFGSQVTKLIARRIRDIGVYSEIINHRQIDKIDDFEYIKGIILSGGPATVTEKNFLKYL
jgi:GMP synthase (glutamine-hydrolysing)